MLASGQSLGPRFTLVRRLGGGGMGEVWLAEDTELGERVVAKILPPDAPEARVELLRRECRHARRLQHPAVVRVFDVHRAGGRTFLTMEHVEGQDLRRLRGRPPAEVLEAVVPVADALARAHELGLVHRDLKPENVLIDAGGRPRLLDFGIAGTLGGEPDGSTVAGGGSRANASPQQRAGEPPRPADDVYALGALLNDLLAGPHPLPEELRLRVASMLAASPDDRPPSMAAVRDELARLRDRLAALPAGPAAVAAEPAPVRLRPPPRPAPLVVPPEEPPPRRRAARRGSGAGWWAGALLLVVLTAAAAAVFVVLPDWVERRRASATRAAASDPLPAEAFDPAAATPAPALAAGEDPDAEPAAPPSRPVPAAGAGAGDPPAEPAGPPGHGSSPGPRETAARAGADGGAFAAAMTEGLAALEREDWPAAREAFERAAALRPGSPESADGLARTEAGRRRAAIASRRERALALEEQERWREAAEEYAAVLRLDPTVAFARQGEERGRRRADLEERLDFHLGHPDRLTSDEVLAEAAELAARAAESEPAGLRRRGERLAALVTAFATPVQVVLVSDELTEVTVYRVGRLGTFRRHALELRPGTYTVVGSRRGYRDVRRRLVVAPGEEPEPLLVRCEEEV